MRSAKDLTVGLQARSLLLVDVYIDVFCFEFNVLICSRNRYKPVGAEGGK